MCSGRDGHVVVDLVHAIAIKAVATIPLSGSVEAADVHVRNTDFTLGEWPVVVVQNCKPRDADALQREIRVCAGIEAVVARLGDTESGFVDDRWRKQVKPLRSEVVVS